MKTCSACKSEKPTSSFNKNNSMKDGLASKCKECSKAYDKEYYLKNQAIIKARTLAWKIAHPEEIQEGKVRYRAKHRESINAKNAAWYSENRDIERARCAKYHAENPHIARARGEKWDLENPEGRRASSARRRGKILSAEGSHTKEDIARIKKDQRCLCAICKTKLVKGYHVDHINPLAKGGSNYPSNLQLLCGLCNRKKGAKKPEDFMRELGFLI